MPTPDQPHPAETQFPGLKDDSTPAAGETPTADSVRLIKPVTLTAPVMDAKPVAPIEPVPDIKPAVSDAGPVTDTPRIERVTFVERIAPREMQPVLVARRGLGAQSRRDFLIYGAGAALAAAGFWWVLPEEVQQRLGAHNPQMNPRKEALLDKSLNFDDDVSKFLYSPGRLVPTFDVSQALPPGSDDDDDEAPGKFRVNYEGGHPQDKYGNYVPHWSLTLSGLASGRTETLRLPDIQALIQGRRHEQVTRLVCVEGWSQIGQWAGLRFADFLAAYPPTPGARWVALRSKYNIATDTDDTDSNGNPTHTPDPYYVSIDLGTARHPQTLLATEQSGRPLTIGHGAPLRLVVPMKLGLKNIKAITSIAYTVEEPRDYWSDFRRTDQSRGYSRYDGL